MESWPTSSLASERDIHVKHNSSSQYVQDLAQGLRDQQQIDAVILDFSKAFDKVSHRHLLLKLEYVAQHYLGLATSWPTARRE